MTSIEIKNLQTKLEVIPRKRATLLIGIDGCGGSGKSTLAKILARILSNVTIVEMDDFYLPSLLRNGKEFNPEQIGSTYDWKRLKNQVLAPLFQNQNAKYQRYDWNADRLAECHTVAFGGVVIVEGVYSTRTELANFYDFRIWVECPREVRLARGIARDGEEARDRWEREWMPMEDSYVENHKPRENADYVVNGNVE